MSEREPTVKKGMIITCARCENEIAEILVDIYPGSLIKASDMKGITQKVDQHDQMLCEKCGYPYFLHGRIHTKDGWN